MKMFLSTLAFVFEDSLKEVSFGEALLISLLGVAVIVAVLALLMVVVKLMSAFFAKKKQGSASVEQVEQQAPQVEVTTSARQVPTREVELKEYPSTLKLQNVTELDAALIMAIVADKCGLPVERLRFLKITRLDEER